MDDVKRKSRESLTPSEHIRAIATPRRVVDGKLVLDRDNESDVEWFNDDSVGLMFADKSTNPRR